MMHADTTAAEDGLAVYVTSHGFGHLNRTAAVLNRVPADVPVTIRSHRNLFDHWRERLRAAGGAEAVRLGRRGGQSARRQCRDRRPGDARAGGPRVMPRRWRGWTTRWTGCASRGSPPSSATRRPCPWWPRSAQGIPGFLMSNFTWADIYAPYARALGGRAIRLVAELRRPTARPRPCSGSSRPCGCRGSPHDRRRHGRQPRPRPPRRAAPALGLSKPRSWSIFYIGRYGQNDLDWSRLERFAASRASISSATTPRPAAALQPARRPVGRLARRRSDRLERRRRRQGRLRHGLRGDGQRHADDLSSATRVRRVSLARPRSTLGRRSADLLARLPRAGAGASAGTRACTSSPAASLPDRRRGADRRHLTAAPATQLARSAISDVRLSRSVACSCRPTGAGRIHWIDNGVRCPLAPGRSVRRPTQQSRYPMKLVIYPAVEPDRLLALQAAADGSEWVNAASRRRGGGRHARRRRFLGKITPGDAGAGRSPGLGAVVHGQPRTLHVPGAPGAPCVLTNVRGTLRRRDRRPGHGLRPLLRPQPAHLHAAAGRASLRAGRRRVGAGEHDAPGRESSTRWIGRRFFCPTRRWGSSAWAAIGCEIARRALAFGMSVRGVDRFPNGAGRRKESSRSSEWNGCPSCWPGAISP